MGWVCKDSKREKSKKKKERKGIRKKKKKVFYLVPDTLNGKLTISVSFGSSSFSALTQRLASSSLKEVVTERI